MNTHSGSIFTKLPMNFLQSVFWMGCLTDKVKIPYQVNLASLRQGILKGGVKYHCTIDLLFRSIFTKLLMNFLQSIFWMGCLIDKVKKPYQVNLV